MTGASRGIGRACAIRLAQAGANVVVNFLSSPDAARETASAVKSHGVDSIAVRADVSVRDDAHALVNAAAEHFGGLDILVSNVAGGGFRPLMDVTPAGIDAVVRTNAAPLVWLTQAAAPLLSRSAGNGKVICVSSHGSARAVANYGAIGASKAALESLMRHLAFELGPTGINFNAVMPGLVPTDAVRTMPGVDSLLDLVRKQMLLKDRDLTAEDVADVVAFLASPGSDLIQGQTIIVDGGIMVRV
ncbi:MAG: SDR family oxidoreductase [Planctomycetaceae bacterium]